MWVLQVSCLWATNFPLLPFFNDWEFRPLRRSTRGAAPSPCKPLKRFDLNFLEGVRREHSARQPPIYIFDKNLRYASSGDNVNYEPKVKEEPKKVEIKEDLM